MRLLGGIEYNPYCGTQQVLRVMFELGSTFYWVEDKRTQLLCEFYVEGEELFSDKTDLKSKWKRR